MTSGRIISKKAWSVFRNVLIQGRQEGKLLGRALWQYLAHDFDVDVLGSLVLACLVLDGRELAVWRLKHTEVRKRSLLRKSSAPPTFCLFLCAFLFVCVF
jgi:hypothetical protein